ncbi:putative helicase [Naematelia encephala]|uniref:Putative helicase n=1 Tax=Naematelia encephala TaxID=71784 RepID=A0A1Y2BL73_9TREE|nr:putative helicase [Naematelia encephala]
MSFRQDKLILLLDTGTSSHVRRTAAKQLAELTVKTFRVSTTPPREEDVKPQESDGTVVLPSQISEEDAWNEVLETISKIIPLLRSRSSETRSAAAYSLGVLASSLPPWTAELVSSVPSSSTNPVDLAALLKSGQTLLASAGREYIAKPVADKAKRRKAMMGSLGLGDGIMAGDMDKMFDDDDDAMDDGAGIGTGTGATKEDSAAKKAPAEPPKDIFEGLSARQVIMLKRKKGANLADEANKMRKLNQQAAVGVSDGSNASTTLPTPQSSPPASDNKPDVVTIDPGAKARAAAAAGGAVEPVLDAEGNLIARVSDTPKLELETGRSPWMTVLDELSPDLTDPAWQRRHGSSLGIMEILSPVASSLPTNTFLIHLARQLVALLALDRFGDFVGDTVIAPVRETAAQCLGVLLKYMDIAGVQEVHENLMQMVRQPWAKRGKEAEGKQRGEKFAWEVRHAGLLGLKYEVAVRGDLLGKKLLEEDVKPDLQAEGLDLMRDIVQAAILALSDVDDDVRTVAATALLPITGQLATQLPKDELTRVVDTLWDCLAGEGDELGSSVGAIMDLLGALIGHHEIIDLMSSESGQSYHELIPRIYPYIRHTISSVRLAVAKALYTLVTADGLDRNGWMHAEFFSLLFQNLVLEERADIRALSFDAFTTGLEEVESESGGVGDVTNVDNWYAIVMTPVGMPLDEAIFVWPQSKRTGGHNVDKAMMAGDMSLVTMDTVMQTRIASAKALARLRRYELEEDMEHLNRYLSSGCAHQVFLASVIIQEWALDRDGLTKEAKSVALGKTNPDATQLAEKLVGLIGGPPPATYSEMTVVLTRIAGECQGLLNAFVVEAKVSKDKIPSLPQRVDPLSTSSSVFTLSTAQLAVGKHFEALSNIVPKTRTSALSGLKDRQRKVLGSIGYFAALKGRYDVQVSAAVAGALIALRVMPAKLGPVIKSVMDGVKKEENELLQTRAAASVAAFVSYCSSPLFDKPVNPCDKVVRNLFTFLCSDTSVTPVFSASVATEGILSLREEKALTKKAGLGGIKDLPEETEAQIEMRVTRRGASEAFIALARTFGENIVEGVPKFWDGISAALLAFSGSDISACDAKLKESTSAGQDLVDCLTSLRLIAPHLDESLHARLVSLFPPIILALQSSYAVVRNTAAKCIAALCDVMIDQAMKEVVDHIVPLVGDAKHTASRQGAVEAVHHIIKLLDIKALPYVLFLIVPILGRMSDPDESVRLLSTATFASLVKMVPLEAGIPDPPGFSPELLAKRDEERKFLMQLLDGSKAEQYQVPIEIKADLRQYQRDGVSWLAFLAKYQLHGILCDDMGLGKSLQSICIIGSMHFERAARHAKTGSVDSAHLPSLIVCPPTLTGHWYYEIMKFTSYLTPLQYTGTASERAALRSKIPKADVVIASYESIRADIAELSKVDWLYCVLDEGHIIKNAKTKLAAAVKQLRAQHRLLLSGTPIQNNVIELWSLFDFLMPGFLGSEKVFNERFSKPILADRDGKATPKEREQAAAALEALHKQVLPFLLRRLKEDVLHDLPPKIIQDYYCELSPVQKQLYDEFSKSSAADEAGEVLSSEASNGTGQQHVFQSLQYLRKLCNHPALVLENQPQRWKEIQGRLGNIPPMHDISHAPKLEALRQLLLDCGIGLPAGDKLGAQADDYSQHRVLIFCQLRPMLDLIQRDLFAALMPTVSYMRLDGQTDPKKRHAVVQTFNADPRIDVLLLTTSVGGLGLNLTGADTVIFVDHDWNPMKDLQAMDRAHRLGQRKVVNVYRLITRGTLEEKIMGLQRFKLNIASSVVTQQNAGLGSMNTGEVLDLFKVSSEGDTSKTTKTKSTGPMSASKILEGLDELPPEDEYAELSLERFMSKV